MAQYIEKSALVAEIEKLKGQLLRGACSSQISMQTRSKEESYDEVLSFLDTLEVKEVDLEDAKKEELAQKYVDYTFKRHNIDANSKEGLLIYYAFMHGMNKCLTQLRAQKGE